MIFKDSQLVAVARGKANLEDHETLIMSSRRLRVMSSYTLGVGKVIGGCNYLKWIHVFIVAVVGCCTFSIHICKYGSQYNP